MDDFLYEDLQKTLKVLKERIENNHKEMAELEDSIQKIKDHQKDISDRARKKHNLIKQIEDYLG